jgi:hypothetical protein
MALFYGTGDGYARASFAKHSLGVDVILCAPGPSMERVERQPGVFIAALTKAYPIIKPDIFFGMDTPECYDRRIWSESCIKIARGGYQDITLNGRKLSEFPQTYFATVRKGLISDTFRRRGHNAEFLWRMDTLMTALHVLVWMGAGANGHTIYLNGFDLGHSNGRDYAPGIDKTLTPFLRERNQALFNTQIAALAEFHRIATLNGVRVVSTTPGSPINQFMEFMPLNEAIERAQGAVPKAEPLLHSFETDLGKKYLAARAKAKVLPFSRAGIQTALARTKPKAFVPLNFADCPTMDFANAG